MNAHLPVLLVLCIIPWTTAVTQIQCEGSGDMDISCQLDEVIVVDHANWGRTAPASVACGGPDADQSCGNPLADTSIAKLACDGHTHCGLPTSTGEFGEPCFGTSKYLELSFHCEPATFGTGENQAIFCENEPDVEISCPMNEVIHVVVANYGRVLPDNDRCPYGSAHEDDTSCGDVAGTTNKLKGLCNGRNSCAMTVNNAFFTDPCLNTYKYLEIIYRCHPRPAGSYDLTATCDNEMKLYIDGTEIILPSFQADDWRVSSTIPVDDDTQLIAIECVDLHVVPGILASGSNGILTDSSWMCSAVYEDGWTDVDFVGGPNWSTAVETAPNGALPWDMRQGISSSAYWIWTDGFTRESEDNPGPNFDPHVYCRKMLPKPEKKPCTCYLRGDPAARPFDGDWRLVPGAGKYNMFDIPGQCSMLLGATLEGKENPDNRMFITQIRVQYDGDMIDINANGKVVKVNGGPLTLALPYAATEYTITKDGKWTVVDMPRCGYTVKFHGSGMASVMELIAPAGLYDTNDGMCGDCNGHVEPYLDTAGNDIAVGVEDRYKKAAERYLWTNQRF